MTIGNIQLAAVQTNQLQHIIQQLARSPYEGLALQILLLTGAFPDDENGGIGIAYPKDHIGAGFPQGTFLALQTFLVELGKKLLFGCGFRHMDTSFCGV